jgi:hypothetical protein
MGKYVKFNPNLIKKWTMIKLSNSVKTEDIDQWCNEHSHGRWTRTARRLTTEDYIANPRLGTSWYTAVFFKGATDALLFKLAMGGS